MITLLHNDSNMTLNISSMVIFIAWIVSIDNQNKVVN